LSILYILEGGKMGQGIRRGGDIGKMSRRGKRMGRNRRILPGSVISLIKDDTYFGKVKFFGDFLGKKSD